MPLEVTRIAYWRSDALSDLVTALVAAGQLDRAETLIRTADDPDDVGSLFHTVAVALAAVGDTDRAVTVATQITHPRLHAEALITIAEAHLGTATPAGTQSARSLVARVLATPNWTLAVPPLAHIAPAALAAVDDLLTATLGAPRQP